MIIFFGSSKHSAYFLKKALQSGLKIDLVVSRLPKPVGRKQILTENPTVIAAKELGIAYIEKLKELPCHCERSPVPDGTGRSEAIFPPAKQEERLLHPPSRRIRNDTLGLILDYNRIIPEEIIKLFPKGIINIHFSKLPQYRGGGPVQTTIMNGDKEAWITYFTITPNLDDGPILKQTSLPLTLTEDTEELYQKLSDIAALEIPQIIADYTTDRVRPCQQEGEPSFSLKLTTEGCKIDWTKPTIEIDRLIRAAYPEPGAWCEIQSKTQDAKRKTQRLKIHKAHLNEGKLILDIVQLEGKKPVSYKQFLEGYPEAKLI